MRRETVDFQLSTGRRCHAEDAQEETRVPTPQALRPCPRSDQRRGHDRISGRQCICREKGLTAEIAAVRVVGNVVPRTWSRSCRCPNFLHFEAPPPPAGIEPASALDVTLEAAIVCVNRNDACVAPALHFERSVFLDLPSVVADLRAVLSTWTSLTHANLQGDCRPCRVSALTMRRRCGSPSCGGADTRNIGLAIGGRAASHDSPMMICNARVKRSAVSSAVRLVVSMR